MTLLLTNEDTERVLTMADTIGILEQLYRDLGAGSAVYRGRTDHSATKRWTTASASSTWSCSTPA